MAKKSVRKKVTAKKSSASKKRRVKKTKVQGFKAKLAKFSQVSLKRPSNAVLAKAAAVLGALGLAAVAFKKREAIKESVDKIVERAKRVA